MNVSFLCRFQEPSCLDVKVLVESQGQLTASICGSQEGDEDDIICELNVTLPPRNDNDVCNFRYQSHCQNVLLLSFVN